MKENKLTMKKDSVCAINAKSGITKYMHASAVLLRPDMQ